MRRALLLTVTALGAVVCLVGTTGLFAALTDVARTGTNSADSSGLAGSANIQLATLSAGTCVDFNDDLATGIIQAQGVIPARTFGGDFCIRNVGSQTVNLAISAEDLADVELGCTGDEADYGDTTCGSGAGELSNVLDVFLLGSDCITGATSINAGAPLSSLDDTPLTLADLAADEIACYHVGLTYTDTHSTAEVQQAQSDAVTWRFRFDAVAQP